MRWQYQQDIKKLLTNIEAERIKYAEEMRLTHQQRHY